MQVLGLDTSNYTTSAAVFDGTAGKNQGRLLQVRSGELGLRQSDALFQHVKQLPLILEELGRDGALSGLRAGAFSGGGLVGRPYRAAGLPLFGLAFIRGDDGAFACGAGSGSSGSTG